MLSILRRTSRRKDNRGNPEYTKNIARDRLQAAINRDRYDQVAPEVVEALRRDMLATISRHLEVGEGFQQFEICRSDRSLVLVSNIRVKGMARWAAAR